MRKRLIPLVAIVFAVAGFGKSVQANLIYVGGLSSVSGQNFGNAAVLAAALQTDLHTGPLIFLGQFYLDLTTHSTTFAPGMITDPSRFSFQESTNHQSSFISWDLTETGFQMAFVTDQRSESDFSFVGAERVTPDEFVNSLGTIQLHAMVPIIFFGRSNHVADRGSTALLFASVLAGLWLMRQFSAAH